MMQQDGELSRRQLRQKQSQHARVLLGNLIQGEGVKICQDADGRPRLLSPLHKSTESLSISHSHQWLAVGINQSGPLGLDVEFVRPFANGGSIARSMFSAKEARLVASDPDIFLSLWVIREALGKMEGTGLAGALQADGDLVLEALKMGNVSCESGSFQLSYRKTLNFHFAAAARSLDGSKLNLTEALNASCPSE